MKKVLALLLSLILVIGCSSAIAEPNWPDFITIGGGGSSATFYAVATAIGNLISANSSCVATGSATNGGTNNMQLLASGDIEMGMADQFTASMAYNGLVDFEGKAMPQLRAIAVFYRGYFAIEAVPSSDIKTWEDLAGKHVCVGMASSGTETVTREVFAAMGYDYVNANDIVAEYVGASSGTDLLRNGQADAMTFFAPIPDSSQTELILTTSAYPVSLSDEAIAKLTVEGAAFTADIIPAGTYTTQAEDVKTVYVPMVLWTTADMDEEVIYAITKLIHENLDTLALSHNVFAKVNDENIIAGISLPLHAGAERYYREIGIVK